MTRFDLLTFDGVTQPVTEWALDYGIPPRLIIKRLNNGVPVDIAITKPMRAKPGDVLEEFGTVPRAKKRGVGRDLPGSGGTGSVAQERAQIESSANREKTTP